MSHQNGSAANQINESEGSHDGLVHRWPALCPLSVVLDGGGLHVYSDSNNKLHVIILANSNRLTKNTPLLAKRFCIDWQ